jgi:hypothetical protein
MARKRDDCSSRMNTANGNPMSRGAEGRESTVVATPATIGKSGKHIHDACLPFDPHDGL